MATDSIRNWVKNIIRAHRFVIYDDCPGINEDLVMSVYRGGGYNGIVKAFKICGYDIEN